MKLNITTWQRFLLLQIVGNAKGNILRVRKAMKALDVLEMTDAEKKQVGYVEHPGGATWQDAEHRGQLEIKDKEAAHLVKVEAEQYDNWPAAQGELVIDLVEQLGIKLEEEGVH